MNLYIPPGGVSEGQKVIIPFKGSTGVWCTVVCAAGKHARVANEQRGIDKWVPLYDMLIEASI